MLRFRLLSLFIATAVAGILISSWQADGLIHLVFFDGLSGWLFWFVLLPSFAGFFGRLAWQWPHSKSIAVIILVALIPSLLVYWQRHSYLNPFATVLRGIGYGMVYSVPPVVVYFLSIPFLNNLELIDEI